MKRRLRSIAGHPAPVALAALAVVLAGCGDSDDDAKEPPAPSAAAGQIGEATLQESGEGEQVEPGTEITPQSSTEPKFGGGTDARARCANRNLVPTRSNINRLNRAILCLVNGERRNRRIRGLRRNSRLDRASRRHAQFMVRRNVFSHRGRAGSTVADRIRRTGFLRSRSWRVGENIAWGTGAYGTPRAAVASWMRSRPHRRNILDRRFREFGIGTRYGVPNRRFNTGATYVNKFGTVR